MICGSDQSLQEAPNRFALTVGTTCEGHGAINVVLKDGSKVMCPIGYVTNGAPQQFRFQLAPHSCEPTFKSVGPVS